MAILKITDKDYFAMEAISASSLKIFMQNPQYYFNKYISKSCPFVKSEAMTFGSALHCYILEPDEFNNRFMVKPNDLSFATKSGKEFKVQYKDFEFIKPDEMRMIEVMKSAILKKIPAQWLNQKQSHEIAMTTQIGDAWVKGKIDWLIEFDDRCINLDIKTTSSLDDNKIKWAIRDFMYDVQGNIYTRLINDNMWKDTQNYLLFCDKTTLDCRLVNIDNLVKQCQDNVTASIIELHKAQQTGVFTSKFNEVLFL